MAKPRSRVYHGAKTQVRRDALLHSRSRWLHYRSWAKQPGRHLRLNGTTYESPPVDEEQFKQPEVGEEPMKSERDGINPAAKPSGTGCVECSGAGGWWFHLRRCAECGHIGCCDSSPESACIETLRRYGSPDYHEFRAGRAVVLRLSYRAIPHRPEASRSSRASVGSTGARTGRSGAFKLANAASRIGGGSLVRPQASRKISGDNE